MWLSVANEQTAMKNCAKYQMVRHIATWMAFRRRSVWREEWQIRLGLHQRLRHCRRLQTAYVWNAVGTSEEGPTAPESFKS